MPLFFCKVRFESGKLKSLTIESKDEDQVREILADRGFKILHIEETTRPSKLPQMLASMVALLMLAALGYFFYSQVLNAPAKPPRVGATPTSQVTDPNPNPNPDPNPLPSQEPGPLPTGAPTQGPSPVGTPAPLATPAAGDSGPWYDRQWLVEPGRGVKNLVRLGDRELRQAIPQGSQPAQWVGPAGQKFSLQLKDGQADRIFLQGMQASTPQGLTLGTPVGEIRKKHPEAEKIFNPVDGKSHFLINGLAIYYKDGKVDAFEVQPKGLEGWRFVRLVVEPGVGAGPLVLGKPLEQKARSLLGEPQTGESRDRVVYRWGDGKRSIEAIAKVQGKNEKIELITVQNLKSATTKGVGIGVPMSKVKRVYPEATEGVTESFGEEEWRIPGLAFTGKPDRLYQFKIYSVKQREP